MAAVRQFCSKKSRWSIPPPYIFLLRLLRALFSNQATAEAEEKMGNASIKNRRNVDQMPTKWYNVQIPMAIDDNLKNEAGDDSSSAEQMESEQLPELCKSKPPKGRKVAGEDRIKKAHPMSIIAAESCTSFEYGVTRRTRIKRPLENDYLKNEAGDDSSSAEQMESEQLLELCKSKPPKGRKVAGEDRIKKAHPMSIITAESCTSFEYGVTRRTRIKRPLENDLADNSKMHENEAADDNQTVTDQQPQEHKSKAQPKRRKAEGEKCRRSKSLPLSTSLADTADYGTSFDYGVRRSTRLKMRPLKYWKGERFLYGCINNCNKLIGVKYESDRNKLEVEPFVQSDLPEYKELLELAARH